MTDEDTLSVSADRLLFTMASLSPTAADSLDKESYRATAYSDDANEDYILDDTFQHVIQDLTAIGISLGVEIQDITENRITLAETLFLLNFLLPNSLYNIIRTRPRIRQCLKDCVEGNLGFYETLIETYLSNLGGNDDTDPLVPELTRVIERFYPSIRQTETFTDYIENMMNLYHDERPIEDTDPRRHNEYSEQIKSFIGRLTDALALFDDGDQQEVDSVEKAIVYDLLSPANFVEYSYMFLESTESLPEDLHERYKRKMFHYRMSHPWGPLYHTYPGRESPTPTMVRVIACVGYSWCMDAEHYDEYLSEFRKDYPDPETDARIKTLYGKG